jgi:hypothetical protein
MIKYCYEDAMILPECIVTRERIDWPDPTPEMLNDPKFNAIWLCIRCWDINVPDAYIGYMGATGNHVRSILDALNAVYPEGSE